MQNITDKIENQENNVSPHMNQGNLKGRGW